MTKQPKRKRLTDLEKLQGMRKSRNDQIVSQEKLNSKELTPEERMKRLYAPAVCGTQAWLERSVTWEMKQAMEERNREEELEKREKAREIEKEAERAREIESQKRRKK